MIDNFIMYSFEIRKGVIHQVVTGSSKSLVLIVCDKLGYSATISTVILTNYQLQSAILTNHQLHI